ncbi:MAG TPA: PepSY-associated TM helix domain-containing protein [Lacunisphaera sp.]|nr:PepSY-associated TM helix domain-containing protein [Lacunisphaera sp.]
MKLFRSILFWAHLAAGLIAGLSIGIMCFTGTVIAFEDEIVEWAERDARQVAVPAGDAPRLSLADLQQRLRETQPEFRAATVTLKNDPAAAITFSAGREGGFHANPYTGEFRQPASTKTHDFMHTMVDWHRFLGRVDQQRPIGKAINGACNIAFCFLALSGLYLWMPRTWSWRGVKAIVLFNRQNSGKARDFNWHNVIGFWTAPILIVLTLTAIPISFRWGSNLIYQMAGEEPPVPAGSGAPVAAAPEFEIRRPTPDSRPLGYDAILANVQKEFPQWKTITLRSGAPQRRPAPGAAINASAPQPGARPEVGTASAVRAEGRRGEGAGGNSPRTPQPITVTIRESDSWPRTANTILTLNPFTGEVLKREGYADLTAARQIRAWTRFLHTGQALGWPGQLVAGLACLGGCFLVYTGFALSWRRFFTRKAAQQKSEASA